MAALKEPEAVDALSAYYDRDRAYAGTLFLDAEPNDPDAIGASDLYALTTLSMDLDARQGRLLLDEGPTRLAVTRLLRSLSPSLAITDLQHAPDGSAETLRRMYELHQTFRDLLGGSSTRWVFASKLCARKRPRLFPVRDNQVSIYLGGGRPLKSGDGWPGDFSIDMQIYAYLITETAVQAALSRLRAALEKDRGIRVDFDDLRLLDSALWMATN